MRKCRLVEKHWCRVDGELCSESEEIRYYDTLDFARKRFAVNVEAIKKAYAEPDERFRYDFTVQLFDERGVRCELETLSF